MAGRRIAEGAKGSSYDLAVVGAGSAGFSAAITAAGQGAKVALIGQGAIGGTCVNVGCVPSKTMIRAAEALQAARRVGRFPGLVGASRLSDWRDLIAAKDALVASLRQQRYADLLPEYQGLAYLEGAARLRAGGVLVDGTPITAGKVVVATGARPMAPTIAGIEKVSFLTSTTLLELEQPPRSLIVFGGGFVGVELAQMMARLGVETTIACRSRLLPQAEPEISQALASALGAEGIAVRCGVAYESCREDESGVTLRIDAKRGPLDLKAERLLVATGRRANTEALGLQESGISQDARGAIVVDERMRTSRAGVYAAGDVTDRDHFVYMAAYGGKIAALNALNGDRLVYDNSAMPWVVFTDPQAAGVGLSEATATARGHTVRTALLPLDRLPRALVSRDTRGLVKLVAEARSERLIGAQILAPEGGDSIQTAALAIRSAMTVQELADSLFPYLTTVEGLKLAALSFRHDLSRLSCCAG